MQVIISNHEFQKMRKRLTNQRRELRRLSRELVHMAGQLALAREQEKELREQIVQEKANRAMISAAQRSVGTYIPSNSIREEPF